MPEESTVKDQAACPVVGVRPDDDGGTQKQARKAYCALLLLSLSGTSEDAQKAPSTR